MKKTNKLIVENEEISLISQSIGDFICLTDIVKNEENGRVIVSNWLRKKDTLEFLGLWEKLHNPNFKLIEFDEFVNASGTNRFTISPKQWVEKTGAIGISSKSGNNGGTYAHTDIAFNFLMWFSPEIYLYVVKEFQRLKQEEYHNINEESDWKASRILAKGNYIIQTDAIKEVLEPLSSLPPERIGILYAEEADIVNYALFNMRAKDWRDNNPDLVRQGYNIRDVSSKHYLIVLSNLESKNSDMIRENIEKGERLIKLREKAISDLKALSKSLAIENTDVSSPIKKKIADNPNKKE